MSALDIAIKVSFDKQLNAALANVDKIPLHMMMNFVIWDSCFAGDGRHVLFEEAVEAANLYDNDIVGDTCFVDGCVSIISKHLKMANDIEFSHAVNTLLVKLRSEKFVLPVAKILVAVAERLTPAQQHHVENELHMTWQITLEECEFDDEIFSLLPMLAKKQPDLEINVHTHVTQGLEFWFINGSITDTICVIDAISDMRRCLTQDTCDVVCERLREVPESFYTEIYEEYVANDRFHKTLEARKASANDEVGYFREAVEKALKRLSRSSMTWTRMLPKVRVIGCLSLMCAESAERLYRPGGAGATAAIGRLVAGAKRQRSEV